ncbi:hypothetical protein HY496_02175 [Candidatus Woesearchaeota archaeon]|nr:hypothetical protein [Candidatus Woesearchaeota archaeon]
MRLKKRLDHKVPFPEPLRHGVDYKPVLAILGILFLVSFIGMLNHLEEEALTGGAVQTIGFMKAGKELAFEVKTGGIQSATIHLTEDTKNAKITFEEQDPVVSTIGGQIYSVVMVSSEKPIAFSTLDVTLKIKEEDLLQKGLAVRDVQLYVNQKPLSTSLTDTVDGYLFYSAVATSFGEYVVGEKQAVPTLQKEETLVAEPTVSSPVEASDEAVRDNIVSDGEESSPDYTNIAGQAIQQEQDAESESFFSRIGMFFKNLFS